jgi:hypothetical protein
LGADLQHVYGQDYSQRTEEVPDESPGLGERLNKAVFPEVGDEVQLLDQPGVTGTVLLVHDADRSVDVAVKGKGTMTLPFQYIVVIGDVGEKPPMGSAYSPINEGGGVRMVPMSVLPMIPYGGHRVEQARPKCPECRTRGYRVEANKDEIYYNHGLQWRGPFTEAEAPDLNTGVTCETCGKQFNTTADLVQHEKDEHSGEAVGPFCRRLR